MEILKGIRKHIHELISGFNESELLTIPRGFKTNILWNIGHLTATQQILHYSLSGVEPRVPEFFLNQFRKGSSPDNWEKIPDISEVTSLFSELPDQLKLDYSNGMFKEFKTYTTSAGIILNNFDDAFAFNLFHEGIHKGIIQNLIKLI